MDFQTTLTEKNEKEFLKSWTTVYQSGLLQFRGEKREAGEIGFLRPVAVYLVAFVSGYYMLTLGMQTVGFSLNGLEITFGALVLFIIAICLSYSWRTVWFRHTARKKILPKGTTQVHVDQEKIAFSHPGKESVTWKMAEITKVIFFARTLVIYQGEYKSFMGTRNHVLLINKEDLPEKDCDALIKNYLRPLNLQNKFAKYSSYSDVIIFLILCLVIAIISFPISFLL